MCGEEWLRIPSAPKVFLLESKCLFGSLFKIQLFLIRAQNGTWFPAKEDFTWRILLAWGGYHTSEDLYEVLCHQLFQIIWLHLSEISVGLYTRITKSFSIRMNRGLRGRGAGYEIIFSTLPRFTGASCREILYDTSLLLFRTLISIQQRFKRRRRKIFCFSVGRESVFMFEVNPAVRRSSNDASSFSFLGCWIFRGFFSHSD